MKPQTAWRLVRYLFTTAFLMASWMVFSASWSPFALLAGALGSAGMAAFTYRVFLAEHEAGLKSFLPSPLAFLRFLFLLVVAIYRSSWEMLKAVFTGKASPAIVHFRTRLGSDMARMVLSNAITLTPGTITLDLNDDHLTVYWFFSTTRHAKAAGELVKGRFEASLEKVWT